MTVFGKQMLDEMKVELRAKQVMIAVMDSQNGKVLTMASSNRYLPKNIKRSDYYFSTCRVCLRVMFHGFRGIVFWIKA